MNKPVSFSQYTTDSCHHDDRWRSLLKGLCSAAIDICDRLGDLSATQVNVLTGQLNVQGERQQVMDVFAENRFIYHLEKSKACCMMLSEEQEGVIYIGTKAGTMSAPFMVALDPLDGSSNLAVNVPVGSIFSVYAKPGIDRSVSGSEMLRSGDEQLAAGYFIYGTSTMLVYACNNEVNGFTLDRASGEFILTHRHIRIPLDGTIYAVNDGNYSAFGRGAQNFIRYCRQQGEMGEYPFTARYSGSMVSDIHRLLIQGGIFLYPSTLTHKQGKLRLAYECFPIAYIVETAGGLATAGGSRLLDKTLTSLHQRSPIITGSANLVITAEKFIKTIIPATYEYNRQTG